MRHHGTPMGGGRQGRRWFVLVALCLVWAPAAHAAGITNSGSDLRDGWYSGQPRLTPDKVAASDFGALFRTAVDGQVYAQPLVTGSSVIVATERNKVYALDSETGQPKWTVDLGTPFPYTLIGWGCSDLTPDLGITSTPVIDTATNTIYLTHKTYAPGSTTEAAIYMDALDASTGAQRAGFPRALQGTAQNVAPGHDPQTFYATNELQRPGLLLLDGVVYAGFGGHCDITPYQGWVFGVNASSGAIKARWAALTVGDGAGIWQSGAGLMSDGSGRLFVATGNGGAPAEPTYTPDPARLGESIVRLGVQSDGTLKPQDFFAPSDGTHLDDWDADFASGGVTALRDDAFGTSKYPHLAVAVGKAGYVYLLNRDKLGGVKMGSGQGDDVVARVGPYGGVWSRPGVWPGDGGWIAIPTASPSGTEAASGSSGYLKLYRYRKGTDGTPSLDAPIASGDAFGFSSGAPVITSDGTTSGTATMWVVWAPDGSGSGAQLRAYDAVPVNNALRMRRSFPIGTSTKFSTPGVGNGRVYVGTRDGYVYGYGAPVEAQVTAPATTFPTTTVGQTGTASVTLTATGTVTIAGVSASPGVFAIGAGAPAFPKTLTDGQTLTVPLTFTPAATGTTGGTLSVTLSGKPQPLGFSLTGTGQAAAALLTATPPVVSFGGTIVGQDLAGTITLGNAGGQTLKVTAVSLPGAPFTIDAPPKANDTIAPGEANNYTVHFRPTAVGDRVDELTVTTTGGTKTVGLSGSAGLGPRLALSSDDGWAFGDVGVGASAIRSLTLTNTGDSPMTITRSKPPTSGPFTALDALDEGTVIAVGASRTIRVRFTPAATGPASASWSINAGDGAGARSVPLTGVGRAPGHLTAPGDGLAVGDVVLGRRGEATVALGNDGELPLTIAGVDAPGAPFTLLEAPAPGTVVTPGASVPVRVAFDAAAPGASSGSLAVRSSDGDLTVPVSARAVTSGALEVGGPVFGDVTLGGSGEATVTLRNAGAGALWVRSSAPPAGGPFAVVDDVAAGLMLAPGEARAVRVRFAPVALGDASADWVLATTADAGPRRIALTARGVAAPVVPPVLVPPQTRPPAKVKAKVGLKVTRMRLSRDGRTVTASGRISSRATGTLKLTLRSYAEGRARAIISRTTVRLERRSTYAFTFRLPAAVRRAGWTRLVADASYRGSATVAAGAARLTLVPAPSR